MVSNLQQSSHLPSSTFHSYHQTHWPPLFCCLTFSFQSSFPTVSDLRSHLWCSNFFASVKPLYRYLSSLLHQHSSPPRERCFNKSVFLSSNWNFSASVRCYYEPWLLQVPSKMFCTSPAPVLPPAIHSPVRVSFSSWLSSTQNWTSGGPCLGLAWHFHLLLPSHPSLDLSVDCFSLLPSQNGHAAWRFVREVVRRGFSFVPVFALFHMLLPIISFYSVLQAQASLITSTWFSPASTGG